MIAFVVDGEELDLMPGYSIPIEWESSLFSDEFVLNGISTLPVPLPFTDKNKRLLKHFHIVENKLKNLQIECRLFLGGNLWCIGTLTVAIKAETFDTDFSEITPFAQDANKKLSELFDDNDFYYLIEPYKRWWAFNFSINLGQAFYRVDVYVNGVLHRFDSDPVGSAALSVLIDQIYAQMIADADVTAKFNVQRQTPPSGEELIYVEDLEPGVLSQTDNYNIVCPWLLNSITYGTPVDWLVYQRNAIQTALDLLVDTTFGNSDYCFPIIRNPDFYGTKNLDYTNNERLINNYSTGYLLNDYTRKYQYSISPQPFLFAILNKLCSKYGAIVKGSLAEISQIYSKCFVYNNFSIDLIGIDGYYISYITGTGDVFNVFNGKIFIKNHVPDVTLKEFLTTIKNYLCCGIFYRNFELIINTCQSILKSEKVIDWTNKSFRIYDELKGSYEDGYLLKYDNDSADSYLSEKVLTLKKPVAGKAETFADLPLNVPSGVYYLVEDENAIYVSKGASFVSNSTRVTWSYFSIYLHDYPVGNSKKDINCASSPTINDWHSTLTRRIFVPHIYQLGSSNEYELDYNPVKTRLLFYWRSAFGQIRDGGTDETPSYSDSTDETVVYPYASMHNLAPDGTKLGDYSLQFHGEDGLYQSLHKEWLEFRNNAKPFRIQIILHENELLQLIIFNKIQIGPSQFLIAKIAAPVSINEHFVSCTVDLYKI